MALNEVISNTDQKMIKSIESFKGSLSKIRTGRAHTGLLEHILVDYYGNPTSLTQVANLGLADARTITVTPWEKPMVAVVEKAIRDADLGLNPSTQGNVIRVPMPALTEERRKEFVKVVKNMAEDGRIAVRNVRRDARKLLETAKKDGEISQDELDRAEKELESLTHTTVESIDKAFTRKEHELLEV